MTALRDMLSALLIAVIVGLAAMTGAGPAGAAGAGDDHGSSGSAPKRPVYVRLDAITVTVFRNNEPSGLYTAALTLELAQAGQRAVVDEARSRLRDAMLRQLHALVEREETTGTDVSVEAVKNAMRAVARRVLGADVVVDLYVHSVLRKGA